MIGVRSSLGLDLISEGKLCSKFIICYYLNKKKINVKYNRYPHLILLYLKYYYFHVQDDHITTHLLLIVIITIACLHYYDDYLRHSIITILVTSFKFNYPILNFTKFFISEIHED